MATQPIENIEAVLGRFQAWTGARNATEPRSGIREIPYDEALASDRYRWKGANSQKKAARKPDKASAAPVKAEPDGKQRTAKPVQNADRGKVRESGKAARVANVNASGETRRGSGNHCAAIKAAAPGKSAVAAEPEFHEALAAAIRPAEVSAQPVEPARQVAISIRLSPSERALIRTRAAEAGITASAYIRQCALEVEQLRDQVRSAIVAMGRGVGLPASVSALASSPAPGFLVRLFRRLFRGSAPAWSFRA